MASDGTNLYLFVNHVADTWVFASSDNGANWTQEATITNLSVFQVQIDNRGSPTKLRLHGGNVFSQKDFGTTSWSAVASNGLNGPFYGVTLSGALIVSDNINGPFEVGDYRIKREVAGVFTETLPGF